MFIFSPQVVQVFIQYNIYLCVHNCKIEVGRLKMASVTQLMTSSYRFNNKMSHMVEELGKTPNSTKYNSIQRPKNIHSVIAIITKANIKTAI